MTGDIDFQASEQKLWYCDIFEWMLNKLGSTNFKFNLNSDEAIVHGAAIIANAFGA